MLFKLIDNILSSKKPIYDSNIDDDDVHPYIVNRWISMYSTQMAILINSTGNWLYSSFKDQPIRYFNFLRLFLPRVSKKRIFYIKRNRSTSDDEELNKKIVLLSKQLELSQREIKYMLDITDKMT